MLCGQLVARASASRLQHNNIQHSVYKWCTRISSLLGGECLIQVHFVQLWRSTRNFAHTCVLSEAQSDVLCCIYILFRKYKKNNLFDIV